ncbi:MAG TPA: hypothetical protein VKE74_03335 [Gemmataceae bacterium]|nr:hypothetical protein [Gemmataceae bacterium]
MNPFPLTAGSLRAWTIHFLPVSPVRLVTADGRELSVLGWRNDGPPADAEGKPTGVPVMTVLVELPADIGSGRAAV